jgi:hypothetical protein
MNFVDLSWMFASNILFFPLTALGKAAKASVASVWGPKALLDAMAIDKFE